MYNPISAIKQKFANKKAEVNDSPSVSGGVWKKRVEASNIKFAEWERRFKCQKLIEYYEGHQWEENDRYEPYVVNMILTAIETKLPGLLFNNPVFHLKPKPAKSDFNFQEATQSAQLKEDTLNYFASGDCLSLTEEILLAILDSYFYFGVVEIGYSADWIDNPNAGKPILLSDYDQDARVEDVEEIFEPDQLPEKENIYVKRIPAHRFRVGGNDNSKLERNNWVGYYEFIRIEDLLAAGVTKEILGNPVGIHRSSDFVEKDERGISQSGDLIKVWKIWDIRAKEKLLIKDGTGEILLKPVKFKRLPIKALKFINRLKGFLPVPVSFSWKMPQDEINEAHEMNRSHRRKARSLYQMIQGGADPDEVNKMLTAPDMSVITVTRENAITPIQNPTVDASMGVALQLNKDDFMIVSAMSSEDTGVTDRQTATDAQLKHQKSQIRESRAQSIVANFLCEIGEEIILQVKEKFTLPFWIKANADAPQNPDEIQQITEIYKLITADDLGDEDCIVDVTVESLSPVTNGQDKQNLVEFITLVQQFPLVGTQPDLVYELAAKCNYRNTKVIKQIAKMAQLNLIIQMGQLQNAAASLSGGGQQPGGPMGAGPQQGGPMQQAPINAQQNRKSPTLEAIKQQIGQQIQ